MPLSNQWHCDADDPWQGESISSMKRTRLFVTFFACAKSVPTTTRRLLQGVRRHAGGPHGQDSRPTACDGVRDAEVTAGVSLHYAIGIDEVMSIFTGVGFADVRRVDQMMHQPVIVGRRDEH